MVYVPKTEFASAITQIAAERGIEPETVIASIKEAILAAFRRDARERGIEISEKENYEVEVDDKTGEARVFQIKGKKKKDLTPPGFGRIAAQTAKQVILQKISEAEKSAILNEFSKRIGTLVAGMVLRFEGPNIVVDIGKAEAIMPAKEQVRSEGYKLNQRLTFYLVEIAEGSRGKQIIASRVHSGLVEGLFRREVPEVANGAVEIKAIAREPGERTKIAVFSNRPGIDPVGSCVGQKGVRVQEVINELNGEKIDIIQYNEEIEKFIAAALSPAEGVMVKLDKKKKEAKVTVPEDQLSLAIGNKGQNARLAAKLTGFKVDLVGAGEAKPRTVKKPASARAAGGATAGKKEEKKKQPKKPASATDRAKKKTEKKAVEKKEKKAGKKKSSEK
jgi:N utilization substance protein A